MYSKTFTQEGISFEIVIQRCTNDTKYPKEIEVEQTYAYSAKIFKEGTLANTVFINEEETLIVLDKKARKYCDEITFNEGFTEDQETTLTEMKYIVKT